MAKSKAADTETSGQAAPGGKKEGRDWGQTLFLPKTEFPMRAGLSKLEPRLLAHWQKTDLYGQMRKAGKGRPNFVLHDGPPYANGNIHIGHALNKILKDIVVKSQQMLGQESPYVPGWDCHGLPIEWKIEEQYRAKGKDKPDFSDPQGINAFREECRAFAAKWVDAQRQEFKRLGVLGDWDNPYLTMDYKAEATIADELMKFAKTGQLYRGSKPVMWSVVEKTALAEAEVEYHDHQSDQIWVKFPAKVPQTQFPENACVVIWTTTPWTIPGNRAISFSSRIAYSLYKVTAAPDGNWAGVGETFLLADSLAYAVMKSAKVEAFEKVGPIKASTLQSIVCRHPLHALGYGFDVPLLNGEHVTDATGTGFVHTAPGHGADDYNIWNASQKALRARGIDTTIPFTVDADGVFTDQAPGFSGKRVLKENGSKGDANEAVIKALADAGMMVARGRLKHQYPHSWRSKKPVIFRNTPQWFIAMDKPLARSNSDTLRNRALSEIKATKWVPAAGENRITGMIENRPDWVVSRQRAWGVPITVFRNIETDEVIPGPGFDKSDELIARIRKAFEDKGADVWFEAGAKDRFLEGLVADPGAWEQVRDVLDVWFDSGSTHAFVLNDAEKFPSLAGINRVGNGGKDRIMYLEGSDQHRGWFHSSLLEACGTRGAAPYDIVLTHGFVLDEKGQKMSKAEGNVTAPQEVIEKSGADILRLWVAASDYSDDLRVGPEILKTFSETYRKLRNTMRWMLGTLHHFDDTKRITDVATMPALERYMLHRLATLGQEVEAAFRSYQYRRAVNQLMHFMNTELSAFYFDIRKDALYCDAPSSARRLAALTVVDEIFRATTIWLAPILSFTAEEAWLSRYGEDAASVHLAQFPSLNSDWRDDALAATWDKIRKVRAVVTGALELARAEKQIGSSLEAAPDVYINDAALSSAVATVDLAEVAITSAINIKSGTAPVSAFTLPDVANVAVVAAKAQGTKCARSWRITSDIGSHPAYPELSARDAAAMAEIDAQAQDAAG